MVTWKHLKHFNMLHFLCDFVILKSGIIVKYLVFPLPYLKIFNIDTYSAGSAFLPFALSVTHIIEWIQLQLEYQEQGSKSALFKSFNSAITEQAYGWSGGAHREKGCTPCWPMLWHKSTLLKVSR